MNILIIGGGGRECTFAWKCAQSPHCDHLFIAPGNAGTIQYGENIFLQVEDFAAVKQLVVEKEIDLVIVGPEAPLVAGIQDFFQQDIDLKEVMVLGPDQYASQLEGSKAFAKKFMAEYNIPTASYGEYTSKNMEDGMRRIAETEGPIVLKADGLAGGKGVLILEDKEEAKNEFLAMLEGKFGPASEKIVIEDFLDGIEFSVFVLTDGEDYVVLPEAKDYKRIGEGDTGLNTGGMGAVSPVPFYNKELREKVESRIIIPTIEGIKARKMDYRGFIFLGLIMVGDDPYVIEYNVRMGDPETEVVLPRVTDDIVPLLMAAAERNLGKLKLNVSSDFATTIMLVSGGYPGKYEKGKTITGLDQMDRGIAFHAGTGFSAEGAIVTSGGRVLAMTGQGSSIDEALHICKHNANIVDFEGKYFRSDIGKDLAHY